MHHLHEGDHCYQHEPVDEELGELEEAFSRLDAQQAMEVVA